MLNIVIDDLIFHYGGIFEKHFWKLSIEDFLKKNKSFNTFIVNRTNTINHSNLIDFTLPIQYNFSNLIIGLENELKNLGLYSKNTVFISPYPLSLPSFFSINFVPKGSLFYKNKIINNQNRNFLQDEYLKNVTSSDLNVDIFSILKKFILSAKQPVHPSHFRTKFYANIDTRFEVLNSNSIFDFEIYKSSMKNINRYYIGPNLIIDQNILGIRKYKLNENSLEDINGSYLAFSDLNTDLLFLSFITGYKETALLKLIKYIKIDSFMVSSQYNKFISENNLVNLALTKSKKHILNFACNKSDRKNRLLIMKSELIL